MIPWLPLTALGYFLNAIAALIDKFFLEKIVAEPVVYTFFVSIMSLTALVFVPFGFSVPPPFLILISLLAGFSFTAALFLFFTGLKHGEVSRVVPLVGGASAVFIFFLAWLILEETLNLSQTLAFLLIIAGGYVISYGGKSAGQAFLKNVMLLALLAAFAFAFSHVLSKFVYMNHAFLSGFVWRSFGSFLGGVLLFAMPWSRKKILQAIHVPKIKSGLLFFFGQGSAAASFVIINYAFTLGPIALVNALSGIQYLFVFLMAWGLARFLPDLAFENWSGAAIRQKITGILAIFAGVFFLFM